MIEYNFDSESHNGVGPNGPNLRGEDGIRIYTHTMEVEVYWDREEDHEIVTAVKTIAVGACIHEMLDPKQRHALIRSEIENGIDCGEIDFYCEDMDEIDGRFEFQVTAIESSG